MVVEWFCNVTTWYYHASADSSITFLTLGARTIFAERVFLRATTRVALRNTRFAKIDSVGERQNEQYNIIFRPKRPVKRCKRRITDHTCSSSARNTIHQQGQNLTRTLSEGSLSSTLYIFWINSFWAAPVESNRCTDFSDIRVNGQCLKSQCILGVLMQGNGRAIFPSPSPCDTRRPA